MRGSSKNRTPIAKARKFLQYKVLLDYNANIIKYPCDINKLLNKYVSGKEEKILQKNSR